MKKCFIFLIFLLATGCHSSKFYEKIKENYSEDYYFKKANKYILHKFTAISEGTNHIIYLYIPTGGFYSDAFCGVIYDVDNDKYYELKNITGNIHDTEIFQSQNIDIYRDFIISKYRQGEIDYLIWLGNTLIPSGSVPINFLYDLDLTTNKYKKYEFNNISFEDDVPFVESKLGKQQLEYLNIKPYKGND